MTLKNAYNDNKIYLSYWCFSVEINYQKIDDDVDISLKCDLLVGNSSSSKSDENWLVHADNDEDDESQQELDSQSLILKLQLSVDILLVVDNSSQE